MKAIAITDSGKSLRKISINWLTGSIDKFNQSVIILANNTRHAFRKICAPWRVTCFWGR